MWQKILNDSMFPLFDEEAGGEGDGAGAAGGSLIGGVEEGSGAAGDGNPDGGAAADDAGGEGAGEGQPGDKGKPSEGEGEGEGDGEEEYEGAPESYEDFEVPEGFNINPEALESFQEFAKEWDLSQEHAQELVDFHAKEVKSMMEDQQKAWTETRETWVKDARNDEEFGGQAFNENMKHVATAVNEFGSPELRQVLNQTGLGDHPELVRFFYRVGKLAGEGNFHTGQGGSSGETDPAKTLYPDMN